MSAPRETPRNAPGGARSRRTLVVIALVVLAPVVLSYGFYYLAPPGRFTNYGELLPTVAFPAVQGTRADGAPFDLASVRGRWALVLAAPATCDAGCATALYAGRQARAIQGKDADRVVRVWLASGEATPDPALLREHSDVIVARVPASAAAALPRGAQPLYLVDPLGNQVLAWPRDPDVKAMAKDIGRLLKASRIG